MPEVAVTWIGGNWFLKHDGLRQPAPTRELLDSWLALRGATRADLTFPSQTLRERFIHEFGRI
jgi:hypothetical protein